MAKKAKKAKQSKKAKKPMKAAKKPAAKAKKSAPARKAKPVPAAKGYALMSVAPGFTASDAQASLKWYCDVLGFKVKERWEHEGVFHGGQVVSGSAVINIGQDDWKMGRDRIKGQGTRMYIMTGPEIDKYADAIKARGGKLDQEPADGWGMRTFSISDPDGFKLTFMTGGNS